MSNRVEELESTVAELESTVDGLTEELVEAKERIRELESELQSARTDDDEGSSGAPDREEFERMKRKLERARAESGDEPGARRREVREAGPEEVAAAAPEPGEEGSTPARKEECFETTTEGATEEPDETDDFERDDEIIIA